MINKWSKKLQRWKYAWIQGLRPSEKGWYNARINHNVEKNPTLGFYYDGCEDSLWRYWDGKSWSIGCSQRHNEIEVSERLKEFAGTFKPEDVVYNYEYPGWVGRYTKVKKKE